MKESIQFREREEFKTRKRMKEEKEQMFNLNIWYYDNKAVDIRYSMGSKLITFKISAYQKKEYYQSPTEFVKNHSRLVPYGEFQFLLTNPNNKIQMMEFEEGNVKISISKIK